LSALKALRQRNPHPLIILSLSTLLFSLAVDACGPDFPNRLLMNRTATLLALPEGNYAWEASRLTPKDPQLPTWKAAAPASLPPTAQIQAMRAAPNIDAAWKAGAGLPMAARLYTKAALAFSLHDPQAADYFRQVLALPMSDQAEWHLKALYSLGRTLIGDGAKDPNNRETTPPIPLSKAESEQAIKVFQQLIDAVKNGAADPDLLSLSSLGQQARIYFRQKNIPLAAQHYARQAAQGDPEGIASLTFISGYLIKAENNESLRSSIQDPLVQQLITIELLSRSGNKQFIDPILTLLSQANKQQDHDKLAALAYRSGKYTMAEALIKNSRDSGLAWWLRAKIALRQGDIPAATAAYAKAAAQFPSESSPSYTDAPTTRIAAEQALLALHRDDYLQAMDLLYCSGQYWMDVADVAERVLAADELKNFVDQHTQAAAPLLRPVIEGNDSYLQRQTPSVKLRELLARRLMRLGRYSEAQSYFEAPNYREWAQQYAQQRQIADDPKVDKPKRAQAYFRAATLLRAQGMEFSSYEMTPDYGGTSLLEDAFKPMEQNARWISKLEASRAQQSLPESDQHFLHYRWKASALAVLAADLLSPKSQAYAAVLCKGASWVIQKDSKAGSQLYLRYIKTGKQFDWAPKFGHQCPDPDFTALKS
jgi:hypothetical protein